SARAAQPVSAVKAWRAWGRGSLARQRSARTRPARTQLRARAVAILPAPRKPTRKLAASAMPPHPPAPRRKKSSYKRSVVCVNPDLAGGTEAAEANSRAGGQAGSTPARARGAGRSLPAEHQVERPAAPHVGPRPAEVRQDGFVRAAGLLQGVRQDGKAGIVQGALRGAALVIGGLCQGHHAGGPP